jgi:cell fate regulator YaaT (PSP1 superfamily)
VLFHPNRREALLSAAKLDVGQYVVTDADRGFDVGRIVSAAERPKDASRVRRIVRKATQQEVNCNPAKEERERAALQLCRAKAREMGLPMQITGAEFQHDGKKLTFYYAAFTYVDFRGLVRSLFKVFGTRIWMVWCDGGAPVKDVYSRRPVGDDH